MVYGTVKSSLGKRIAAFIYVKGVVICLGQAINFFLTVCQTRCVLSVGMNLIRLSQLIESDLEISTNWAEGHGLTVDPGKTEIYLFTRRMKISIQSLKGLNYCTLKFCQIFRRYPRQKTKFPRGVYDTAWSNVIHHILTYGGMVNGIVEKVPY